ncbi:MAG: L-lactate dehydrogenase [Synergistaceae bacterium]|nr:L-lactate dehydrogenase [Synergistaceae bacterium]
MSNLNLRKAAIIGCGFVGSSSAFALMQSGLFSELVLIDSDRERAEGEALDIAHGMPLARPMRIYAGNYDDASDAAIMIITAGANQKPGETRLDLVKRNVAIFRSVIPGIPKHNYQGIVLIVANPVDILTYAAVKFSGISSRRVIGTGTVLDTVRLKYLLSEHLNVDSRSIHAYIIGEHGDSEFAAWSSANISGVPLFDFCKMRGHTHYEEASREIEEKVRNSAYEIIKRKHATYYGIAMSVKRICEAIIRDEKSVLPVSSLIDDVYSIRDVALSMPAIIGKDGVEDIMPIRLSYDEQKKLQNSAEVLREVIDEVL